MKKKQKSITYLFSPSQRQLLLIIILAFSFFTRMFRLDQPQKYIFDEVYHAVSSHLVAQNDPWAFEWWNPPPEPNTAVDWLHPPLAKYTQAFFIDLFGYTSFGWRISSVLFGVGVIYLTYKLGATIFKHEEIGLLAALLASFDGLLLAQSRIAMNDIHVTFFILLTLYLYWQYRQIGQTLAAAPNTPRRLLIVGFSAGLAMASKWSGVFVLAIILIYEARDLFEYFWKNVVIAKTARVTKPNPWLVLLRTKLLLALFLVVVPFSVYVASYGQMFMQGKSLFCHEQVQKQGVCYFERFVVNGETKWEGYISHFAMLHRQIWWYQTNLKATHSYQSRPWQWFLNLRPVWFDVQYFPAQQPPTTPEQQPIANIYAIGNTALFWLGDLSLIATVVMLVVVSKKPRLLLSVGLNDSQKSALIYCITAYALVWMPWVASPRIMFFYHYTPAVPLLALVLAFWLYKGITHHRKTLVIGSLLAVISIGTFFIIWYPQVTGIPVPTWFANKVYYIIPSWK